MPNWIIALLGVMVGFALNEISTTIRSTLRSKQYRAALDDELRTNLHQISQKEDIANQMIRALAEKRFLPGQSVPFASTV